MHRRAYFHVRCAIYIPWLLIQPAVERILLDARGIAASRRH